MKVDVVLLLYLPGKHIERSSSERQYLLQITSILSMGILRRQYHADLTQEQKSWLRCKPGKEMTFWR